MENREAAESDFIAAGSRPSYEPLQALQLSMDALRKLGTSSPVKSWLVTDKEDLTRSAQGSTAMRGTCLRAGSPSFGSPATRLAVNTSFAFDDDSTSKSGSTSSPSTEVPLRDDWPNADPADFGTTRPNTPLAAEVRRRRGGRRQDGDLGARQVSILLLLVVTTFVFVTYSADNEEEIREIQQLFANERGFEVSAKIAGASPPPPQKDGTSNTGAARRVTGSTQQPSRASAPLTEINGFYADEELKPILALAGAGIAGRQVS